MIKIIFLLTFLIFGAASLVRAHGLDSEPTSPAAWPFGFFSETTVKTKFLITDLEFAPDGSIWLLDKGGQVYKIINNQLSDPLLSLAVNDEKERGLLGIAFDPLFTENGYFYLYYTTGPGSLNYKNEPKNRVARFVFDATSVTVAQTSETIILDDIGSDSGMHNGGGIKIGPDQKLYAPTGEGGKFPANAQSLASLSGKILRLNLDGSIPADNPFVGRKGARPEIWAYGLRNPWRITFDAETGRLYAADVGGGVAEEVNLIEKGKNYGWPQTEGYIPARRVGVTYPVYAYGHTKKGASIIGGDVYRGSNFPAQYQGKYFFGDFVNFQISSVDLAAPKPQAEIFLPDMGGVVDINVGPDGALYLAVADSPFSGHVAKVFYTGEFNPAANKINITASKTYGKLPLVVDLAAAGIPQTNLLQSQWNFGDGEQSAGTKARHIYKQAGKFTAKLAVVYKDKIVKEDSIDIYPGNRPPRVTIKTNLKGKYRAGDKIEFTGQVVDPEDGPIAPEQWQWQAILGHGQHEHPLLAGSSGAKLTVTAPTDGEADANIHLMVMLTAADKLGLATEQHYEVWPQTVSVRLLANIKGVELTLDGKPVKAPYSFLNVVNFPRALTAPATVKIGNRVYKFKKWPNNASREQRIVPKKNLNLTAIYGL